MKDFVDNSQKKILINEVAWPIAKLSIRMTDSVKNKLSPYRHPGKSMSGSASDLSGIHLKAAQWIPDKHLSIQAKLGLVNFPG